MSTPSLILLIAGAVACLGGSPRVAAAETIDLRHLLDAMTDRAAVARYPDPEFTCRQASSYNRRSRTPGNADWFAGHDFDQFYGSVEVDGRREWIMLDADGPGAVTRWWLTQFHNAGTIRVYLDGAHKPLVEGDGKTLVGGPLLAQPPLAAIVGGGRNLYLPIPFREHCRITFESPRSDADFTKPVPPFTNESLFYNINYVQYPAGTPVKSLTLAELEANRDSMAQLGRALSQPASNALPVRRTVEGGKRMLQPGESLVRETDGSGAIAVLRLKLAAKDLPQALRSTVVTAVFDGRQTVAAPVGEFFGSGPGLHPYQSWWTRVEKNGWMTCWWPMPFKKSAEVRVTNHHPTGSVEVEVGEIGIADWTWTPRTMYFHTAWRGEKAIRFGSNSDSDHIKDWNYITIDGKGVYVGDSLSLFNRPVMGGRLGPWWGEGDEKIFVDGEAFPSHFGTGSEDYYGYAFNHTRPFEAPFHAQPGAAGNRGVGRTVNVRGRVLDRIPFKSGLKFDLELFHWQPNVRNDYASTTYWYALARATDNGQCSPENVRGEIAMAVDPDSTKAQESDAAETPVATGSVRPNIIYILADDLGFGDLGCYGQKIIRTPNLDRMAAEGIRFTDHYAGSTVCAPSRCVLMTGKHTGHASIVNNAEVDRATVPMGDRGAAGQMPLNEGEITLARLARQAGYRTTCIGKWGLGGRNTTGDPNKAGFDHFFGYYDQRDAHFYFIDWLWRNGELVELKDNPKRQDRYSHDLLFEEAVRWVEANRDRPFLLYLPLAIPHAELIVPADSMEPYAGIEERGPWGNVNAPYRIERKQWGLYNACEKPRQTYAGMVSRLDRDVGRLLDLLKRLDLAERTLVLFSSDNGPHNEGGADPAFFTSAGPLRGGKRSLYEGGIRVPLIAWQPGKIEAGAVSGHPSAFWDVMPTVCELVGVDPPGDVDGISLLPTLYGKGLQKTHDYLYWQYGGGQAIRRGKWKAVGNDRSVRLYDLDADVGEKTDLSAQHPDVADALRKLFAQAGMRGAKDDER